MTQTLRVMQSIVTGLLMTGCAGVGSSTINPEEVPISAAPISTQCVADRATINLNDQEIEDIQLVLAQMEEEDQVSRMMVKLPTFNRENAVKARALTIGIDEIATYREAVREVKSRYGEELSETQLKRLKAIRLATDETNTRRLLSLIMTYGWPSKERSQSEVSPVVFLLHMSPTEFEALTPLLLCEVKQGRMAAKNFANGHDKAAKIRGDYVLYGVGQDFDPVAGKMLPPIIESKLLTDKARAEIGLDSIESFRLAAATP